MMKLGEMWASLGSVMAGIMFLSAMCQRYFPYALQGPLKKYMEKCSSFLYPFIEIQFPEYEADGIWRSRAYAAIERYLERNSSSQAKRLRAKVTQDCKLIVLSMQDYQEVSDDFQGMKFWWGSRTKTSASSSASMYRTGDGTRRNFTLTLHKRHREVVVEKYLIHVFNEGKAMISSQRQRKLYTNSVKTSWSHVTFQHPSTFDTLAVEPKKKKEIIDDLMMFSKAKEYYAKIGKVWKRGYLLYGPPGTGKSSMIAAMANFMNYDVYDLQLTSVQDDTELRKLLIDTSSKSIIVIEDIDCSLDLTGKREKKKVKMEEENNEKEALERKSRSKSKENEESTNLTLSGLLNSIDGLWSACSDERLIVLTTNHVQKLDPALIRRGRMDKHIELSYCGFEEFKDLAKNYLNIESHELLPLIGSLLKETNITPADVGENLMPKSPKEGPDVCLKRLIKAIEQAKEDANLKAKEERQNSNLPNKEV